MGEEVDRLDKAFEWVVLFVTISYATLIQLLTWFLPAENMELGRYIFFVVRLLFVPLLIIILIWLAKFATAGPKKMFFRKLAWSWGMFQLATHILSTMILVTTDQPRDSNALKAVLFSSFALIPIVTYAIYRKIMGIYKKATPDEVFWSNKWWDHGSTLVSVLSLALFLIFIYALPGYP